MGRPGALSEPAHQADKTLHSALINLMGSMHREHEAWASRMPLRQWFILLLHPIAAPVARARDVLSDMIAAASSLRSRVNTFFTIYSG
jgi:hypothetical protein